MNPDDADVRAASGSDQVTRRGLDTQSILNADLADQADSTDQKKFSFRSALIRVPRQKTMPPGILVIHPHIP